MENSKYVESERGNWAYQSSNNFFSFHKAIERKTFSAFESHGPRWVLGLVKRLSGEVRYKNNQFQDVVLGKPCWAFFYPKFSIAFAEVLNADLEVNVISSRIMTPTEYLKPVVFHPKIEMGFPDTIEQVLSYIQNGKSFHEVDYSDKPNWISSTAKRCIDRSFSEPEFSIQELSAVTRISASQISRSFKKDFAISPVKYRNHLRVISSLDNLLQGAPVSKTALEVGFNDISRFNKNFKATQRVAPSSYSPDPKRY